VHYNMLLVRKTKTLHIRSILKKYTIFPPSCLSVTSWRWRSTAEICGSEDFTYLIYIFLCANWKFHCCNFNSPPSIRKLYHLKVALTLTRYVFGRVSLSSSHLLPGFRIKFACTCHLTVFHPSHLLYFIIIIIIILFEGSLFEFSYI
jgi:hypothetical protein